MVHQLDERARKFAEVSAKHFGYDYSEHEGAGAAGGLGYAFLQYMNADCKPGIVLLLETIQFDEIVRNADLVITGEVCLIAGRISDKQELLKAGFARVECINPEGISLEEAMRKEVAIQNIIKTVGHYV